MEKKKKKCPLEKGDKKLLLPKKRGKKLNFLSDKEKDIPNRLKFECSP